MTPYDLKPDSKQSKLIIERLRTYWSLLDEIEFFPIYEPNQWLCLEIESSSVIIDSPEVLRSWMIETCHSFVVKSRHIEKEVYSAISRKDVYTASILLRHHMELCGLITLSLDKFLAFIRGGDEATLSRFIAETSFGSAFKNNKRTSGNHIAIKSSKTVQVSSFIQALDRFVETLQSGPNNKFVFTTNYAFLCHFAHPNSYSTSLFTDSDTTNNGNLITFRFDAKHPKGSIIPLLDLLEQNILAGYTSLFVFLAHKIANDGSVEIDKAKIDKTYDDILMVYRNKRN